MEPPQKASTENLSSIHWKKLIVTRSQFLASIAINQLSLIKLYNSENDIVCHTPKLTPKTDIFRHIIKKLPPRYTSSTPLPVINSNPSKNVFKIINKN
jgi:hypothetical protein